MGPFIGAAVVSLDQVFIIYLEVRYILLSEFPVFPYKFFIVDNNILFREVKYIFSTSVLLGISVRSPENFLKGVKVFKIVSNIP